MIEPGGVAAQRRAWQKRPDAQRLLRQINGLPERHHVSGSANAVLRGACRMQGEIAETDRRWAVLKINRRGERFMLAWSRAAARR